MLTRGNKRSEALFVEDMIIAAENVTEFTRDLSLNDLENDHKTSSAVLYNLQIIGEGPGSRYENQEKIPRY